MSTKRMQMLEPALVVIIFVMLFPLSLFAQTWTADNGNGTFTNPLFYEEFSDPDLIRVGEDFYLTGTTMHSMPGLPILHSRDLVNWNFLGYAIDRLDLGPAYRLEGDKQIYGQGIWAPSFRYHNGTFYIFSNVNGQTTQLFRATNPAGPWTHTRMKRSFHDLSVLFDDDGKMYVIWGYRSIKLAQLDDELTDEVPGPEREIIPATAGMGEGSHLYKIKGKYYITSAWYAGRMRMVAARADQIEGPYEVNQAISKDEDFGLAEGYRLGPGDKPPYTIIPPTKEDRGRLSLHQGGVVDTSTGEWWGFSMMDFNSVGRLVSLSPITWKDGWPYFGLPGNLGRTPRTWVKPHTGSTSAPSAPYERSDDFASAKLKPVWQWNHVPDDSRWSLTERPGYLRLHSLAAPNLWLARNTLTQRAIGPRSAPTVNLDASAMRRGDVAGLSLFSRPYAWIGVEREERGLVLTQFDEQTGHSERLPIAQNRVWLRANCDFMTEKATFSYSLDGQTFQQFGREFTMVFQLRTFQGVRYGLFHYNTGGSPGGVADFDSVQVAEPNPHGLIRPIPYGQSITLTTHAGNTSLVRHGARLNPEEHGASHFKVVDRGLGRVSLSIGGRFVSVETPQKVVVRAGHPRDAETFQWIETPTGELVLMSLATHLFLRIDPANGLLACDSPGPKSDGSDGDLFDWSSSLSDLRRSSQLRVNPTT